MFSKGDTVKINYEKLDKTLSKEVIGSFYNFDTKHGFNHQITNVFIKNKYKNNELLRIELDSEFVFYENELIKIN